VAPVAAVGAVLVAYPLVVKDPFWQNIAILALIGAAAAAAWNLLGGFGGQVSFGHSIFFGIGGYTVGYLLVARGVSPWIGLALGAVLAAVAGVVIGFPVFRLRTHYFSIATIALQQVLLVLVINSRSLGLATGLQLPIQQEGLATLQFSVRDATGYHEVVVGLFAVTCLAVWLFMRGRPGAYLRAIRDDEEVARAMGVPVRRYKLLGMAVSAALTALAGGLYVMYSLFVQPSAVLSLSRSIEIVLIAVLGGAGTYWGPLAGGFVLTYIEQQTRVSLGSVQGGGLLEAIAHNGGFDFIIYGALVMLIAVIEPAGLVGLARRVRRRLRL
jgi:branched-chain amino acid transport system permease protein